MWKCDCEEIKNIEYTDTQGYKHLDGVWKCDDEVVKKMAYIYIYRYIGYMKVQGAIG